MIRRHPLPLVPCIVALLVLSACDRAAAPARTAGPPVRPPVVDGIAAPGSSPALRALVDLQVERDGPALRAHLASEDPEIRARAAHALASVQDPEAREALLGLLADPVGDVRREAAFALGQLELDGVADRLLGALGREEDRAVRIRIIEALGKRGGAAAVEPLAAHAAADHVEEATLALALSRLGLRRVAEPDQVLDALIERLVHPDPDVRLMAAYYFGRVSDAEPWAHRAAEVREILQGYDLEEPAAQHLVISLGLQRDRDDRDLFLRLMTEPEDWRIRTSAVRAVATTALLETEGVRDALFDRVERDPSMHVALAAATTLTMGLRVPRETSDRMARWVLEGPRERWQSHLPFVEFFASGIDAELLAAWARRMENVHPNAAVHGIQAIVAYGSVGGEFLADVERFLDHREPLVRAAALGALGHRWPELTFDESYPVSLMERFEDVLEDGSLPEVITVLDVLATPPYIPHGSPELLARSLSARGREAPTPVLVAHLQALGSVGGDDALPLLEAYLDHPEPRVRAAAGEAYELHTGESVPEARLPDPERTIDWALLDELGPDPRLHLETERGEIVIRLAPNRAPLTVQTVAELAREGAYDDTPFHRVVPNFVIQGGDAVAGDGTGSPGFAIRSEFTPIPFRRGVIGMASSGKDTEGSQFFVTHSMQAHLDGGYTGFGWVESGESAMDRILLGDRIVRARIVAGTGAGDADAALGGTGMGDADAALGGAGSGG